MSQLLLLELNEFNFEHLRFYAERGAAPNFARLLEQHDIAETTSESAYEEWEPWIQWVTAHTGLTLAEHRVFRLGDILNTNFRQIWEALEAGGLKVGAISPMNAKNRCRNAAFFVPDPWTRTEVTKGVLLKRFYAAVAQAVNDNAQSRITPQSAAWLLAGAAVYARPVNYAEYAKLVTTAISQPWHKAMLLDLLLSDVFIRETARAKPNFASLFLNAGAHIQHHYLFNSEAYEGELTNPTWYASANVDPVSEVYKLYDRILSQIQATFPAARLMILTGLHQVPHSVETFYWRLKAHAAFLKKLNVPFNRVETRMSRDFLIFCDNKADSLQAERILTSAEAVGGVKLFDVDNRGDELFVTLSYSGYIGDDFVYLVGNNRFEDFRDDVAFVALKNGQHSGIGYFIDTGANHGDLPGRFPLKDIPSRICKVHGLEWDSG